MDAETFKNIRNFCNVTLLEFAMLLGVREPIAAKYEKSHEPIPPHIGQNAMFLLECRRKQIEDFCKEHLVLPEPATSMTAFSLKPGTMQPADFGTEIPSNLIPGFKKSNPNSVIVFTKPPKPEPKPKKEPKPTPNPHHGFNPMDPRTYHLGPKN